VGPGNESSNHRRTGSENGRSKSETTADPEALQFEILPAAVNKRPATELGFDRIDAHHSTTETASAATVRPDLTPTGINRSTGVDEDIDLVSAAVPAEDSESRGP